VKIITVNGIRSTGAGSTDILGAKLAAMGYPVHDLNQPVRSAWGARWKANKDAADILEVAKHGDVLVAHSYGCLKSSIAMRGVNFKAAFLFRPAMSRWHNFPQYQSTKIFCIYSKQDYTILAGSLALYHPFGLAGFSGFYSPFVRNIKSTGAHSDDFHADRVDEWAIFIDNALKHIGVKL